jgi:hypothetical protein
MSNISLLVRPNPVRTKPLNGEAAFGTMSMEFFTPGLPYILADAGAVFVIYDVEHSGAGIETINLVNRSEYGLANSVWTGDADRATPVAERLVSGNSWINAHNVFAHGVSYGGCNLSGGCVPRQKNRQSRPIRAEPKGSAFFVSIPARRRASGLR